MRDTYSVINNSDATITISPNFYNNIQAIGSTFITNCVIIESLLYFLFLFLADDPNTVFDMIHCKVHIYNRKVQGIGIQRHVGYLSTNCMMY